MELKGVLCGGPQEVPGRVAGGAVVPGVGPKPVIRQLAAQLGMHHEALRNWIRQDQADWGERGDQPTSGELEELRRLRKENAELKPANEILKAASAIFAQELDPTRRRS
jgi:transposase